MNIAEELRKSEEFETEIFFRMARSLYQDCSLQCEELFDITMDKTSSFRSITPEIILSDSRIIKVLRYCMLPVISQMKLGQLVDLSTTKDFEDTRVVSGTKYTTLKRIAPRLCKLFSEYMDSRSGNR